MRVILADDAVLFRSGLARLLEQVGVEVVGEVRDATNILQLVDRTQPDAVVLDVRMPPTNTVEGLEAALEIRDKFPDVGVLVLSQYVETEYSLRLLGDRPEGVGYLLKERVGDVDRLLQALQDVAAGGSVIDTEVVAKLLDRRRSDDPLAVLSPREREVLGLMAEGRTNRAICDGLFLTSSTVETHVRSIFRKLDLRESTDDHRRVLAVLRFLRR